MIKPISDMDQAVLESLRAGASRAYEDATDVLHQRFHDLGEKREEIQRAFRDAQERFHRDTALIEERLQRGQELFDRREEIYEAYAASLAKKPEGLTEDERREAILREILKEGVNPSPHPSGGEGQEGREHEETV